MRVVKYPEPEQEIFVTCSKCKAELAYTGSDCFWENGVAGDVKFIICPCCGTKIRIDYTPDPIQIGKDFYYFDEGPYCE